MSSRSSQGRTLRPIAAACAALLSSTPVWADIDLNANAHLAGFTDQPENYPPLSFSSGTNPDFSAYPNMFIWLRNSSGFASYPAPLWPSAGPMLTVNAGSTLRVSSGIWARYAGDALLTDPLTQTELLPKTEVTVNNGTIVLGSVFGDINSINRGKGSIWLEGFGDFVIENGGQVIWDTPNKCDGSGVNQLGCDVRIGAKNPRNPVPYSNFGMTVTGAGSLLDASNTQGEFYVGVGLATTNDVFGTTVTQAPAYSEDFLFISDSGEVRSSDANIAEATELVSWNPAVNGYLRGSAFVSGGTWSILGDGETSVDIGENDGASGLVAILNGGVVDVDGASGFDTGFYIGQTSDGLPTQGGNNLLIVSGTGSTFTVDNNSNGLTGSRIANGTMTVENSGAVAIDSSVLLLSGKTDQEVDDIEASNFTTQLFENFGVTWNSPELSLEIKSGGLVSITDDDGTGISALIIGQQPVDDPALPPAAQTADVVVDGGTLSVVNSATISLGANDFGIPLVSNIGTGSLLIKGTATAPGTVQFVTGDFVVGAGNAYDATVTVEENGELTATDGSRIVVGLTDFEGGNAVGNAGVAVLELNNGVVNGDVIVDDNGSLTGVGTVNGAVIGDGGTIAPGFSPGTITAESFTLGAGTELVLQVALNPDGSVNVAGSDAIIATGGSIDLSAGDVTIALSSADSETTLGEILETAVVLDVSDLLVSPEEVVVAEYELAVDEGEEVDPGTNLDELVEVPVSFIKDECKNDGWEALYRLDGTTFKNQGDCIQYVNTGK